MSVRGQISSVTGPGPWSASDHTGTLDKVSRGVRRREGCCLGAAASVSLGFKSLLPLSTYMKLCITF